LLASLFINTYSIFNSLPMVYGAILARLYNVPIGGWIKGECSPRQQINKDSLGKVQIVRERNGKTTIRKK
jgi:hypothetical protein